MSFYSKNSLIFVLLIVLGIGVAIGVYFSSQRNKANQTPQKKTVAKKKKVVAEQATESTVQAEEEQPLQATE